jgi:tRNA (guanine-N7-)-methyltransferase
LLSTDLERVKVDLSGPPGPGGLAGIFGCAVQEVWLEIGFGAGEHLIWQAQNNLRAGLIGAEAYINGVVAALSAVKLEGLEQRVRIHPDDVMSLLDWLPPASLTRTFMLFPDPWPKKRHLERRLFSPFLLEQLRRVLREGAQLRFASDIGDYADAALDAAKEHPAFNIEEVFTSADRQTKADWPMTRYEMKASKAGRSSTFIALRRTA